MSFAAAALPEPIKRAIRRTLDRLGVEVIARRSNRWLADLGIRTVIDVGANTGQFAHTARRLFPESFIYSFEPLEGCYRELTRSFTGDPKFRGFNIGLGSEDRVMTIHQNEFSGSSSMLEMSELHKTTFAYAAKPVAEASVQVRRLDDVCRDLTLEPEVLVKLDVQGYEDRVIAGAAELLPRVKVVITETSFEPLYVGQPLFDELYKRITALGFRYHGNLEQAVSPHDGRILQADAIFLRP